MQTRFLAAMAKLGAHATVADFEVLDRLYREPRRAYHNWQHIAECLGELDDTAAEAMLAVALFYHDAIYDPQAKGNEENSAQLCSRTLAAKSVAPGIVEQIESLILATKHVSAPRNEAEAAMIDIDLSILGRTAERFQGYERAIRQEYLWAPLEAYRNGRGAILRTFLDRAEQGTLYHLERFHQKFGFSALANLRWALDNLCNSELPLRPSERP